MSQLWNVVRQDFDDLATHLSDCLEGEDLAAVFDEFGDGDLSAMLRPITQSFSQADRYPLGFAETVLANDCLAYIVATMQSVSGLDGFKSWPEVRAFVIPVSKIYATNIFRYERYRGLHKTSSSCGAFFEAYVKDSSIFGGTGDGNPRFIGATVCFTMAIRRGSQRLIRLYESLFKALIVNLLKCPNVPKGERRVLDIFENLVGAANNAFQNIENNSRGSEVADLPHEIAHDSQLEPSVNCDASRDEVLGRAIKELEGMVGLQTSKAEVKRLASFLNVRRERAKHGLRDAAQTLHFVFTGNPGTGKTTVARILSAILFGYEVLKTPKLVECDRSQLVAGYVGQTAIKTSDVIQSALDGVLFIDEAYSLCDGVTNGDFGQEAVNELLKGMEDYRDRLVVVVAGYPDKMQGFLKSNPGLESRFTKFIHFDDYDAGELCQIFEKFCSDADYLLTHGGKMAASLYFAIAYKKRDQYLGNARFVRNAFEAAISRQAERIGSVSANNIDRNLLQAIEGEDLAFEVLHQGSFRLFDFSEARWKAQCPTCEARYLGDKDMFGRDVVCNKCQGVFEFSWRQIALSTVKRRAELG